MVCTMGICMAIIERYKSGKGQVVDANITEGISYVGSWLMSSQNSILWGNPKGQNLFVNLYLLYHKQYYNLIFLSDWMEECTSMIPMKLKMENGWLLVQ